MRKLLLYVICGAVGASLLVSANMTAASELVYTPINPSFGGNPLNSQWLFNLAEAQKQFGTPPFDVVEYFKKTLTRRMFSRLIRDIIDEAFGEGTVEVGHYQIGDYTIDVSTDQELITIVIVELVTEDTTIIQVPYYSDMSVEDLLF